MCDFTEEYYFKTKGYSKQWCLFFYVLLTVHLSIILAINQPNAQNPAPQQVYCMPLHASSTMCSSSGGQDFIIQHLVS